MLRPLWKFIRDSENRQILSWLGGGVVIIVPGIWAALNYFFPHADNKPAAAPSPAITQSARIASGRDTVINGPVAIGLDEQQIQLRIAAAQKPLTDQFEKLAAHVAREKGVEVATLRAILIKLGEAGVADQDVAKRLDEKADELIKLREEIAQLRHGGPQVASLAQTAQDLIDSGDLDGSRAVLAFIDHFRRTGSISGKLAAELNAAAPALTAAANNFAARGDHANAAQTQIRLGDIHRMQERWVPALDAYRTAEILARRAGKPALLARALKLQAQVESNQRDYGNARTHAEKARAHAEQALGVSQGLDDKKLLGDALLVLSEVQIAQADLSGAADSLNQTMIIADELSDDELRFYAFLDRADIWMKSCDLTRPSKDCVEKIDLAVRDYTQARAVATRLDWTGLVREMDGFITRAGIQAQAVRAGISLKPK